MSIKTKMVTLLVISLLIVGLIIAGSGMFVLYQQTLHSTQITMVNQAVQLSGQVSDLFDSFDKSGKIYGQDSDLQSNDPARIQAKIDTYYGVTWGVDRLNFLDQTGKRLAIAPYDTKVIGDSLADRAFFKATLQDQKSHVSDIIVNRVTGVPSVIVTQPVKDPGGKLTGMVLQAVNLETLQNYLGQVKVGATGVAAIISEDGTLIAHTNRNLVKEQKKIAEELMTREGTAWQACSIYRSVRQGFCCAGDNCSQHKLACYYFTADKRIYGRLLCQSGVDAGCFGRRAGSGRFYWLALSSKDLAAY